MLYSNTIRNKNEAKQVGIQYTFHYESAYQINRSNNKKYGSSDCKLLYLDHFSAYSGSVATLIIHYISCNDGILGYLINSDRQVHEQLMKMDKQMN